MRQRASKNSIILGVIKRINMNQTNTVSDKTSVKSSAAKQRVIEEIRKGHSALAFSNGLIIFDAENYFCFVRLKYLANLKLS